VIFFFSPSQNKSLKNKLLSGNKLCGIHAEEVSKVPVYSKSNIPKRSLYRSLLYCSSGTGYISCVNGECS